MTDGYTATYGSDEVSEVSIDLIVGVLAAVFSLVTLVGLILIFGWARKRMPKIG